VAHVVGIDVPFEEPCAADLVIDNFGATKPAEFESKKRSVGSWNRC
jgi:adenylylsulfate kinase-like enzyme